MRLLSGRIRLLFLWNPVGCSPSLCFVGDSGAWSWDKVGVIGTGDEGRKSCVDDFDGPRACREVD